MRELLNWYSVLASPSTLPGFWIFMYRVSPFTYLISAMLSVGLANTNAECAKEEVLTLQPANNRSCGDYMASYVGTVGGKVYNPNATRDCKFCALDDTNVFLASVSSSYDERWRNFGLMWVYIIFNIFAAVFIYWLVRVPKRNRKVKTSADMENETPGTQLLPVKEALTKPSSKVSSGRL